MELEEMKVVWGEMSAEIEKQKKLTDSLIIKMTQVNYRSKIGKVTVPETIGSLVCLATALFIFINFQQLGTWYLQVCGVASAVISLLLAVLSLKAANKLSSINILNNNFKQSLADYSKGKIQFALVKKLSFYLGAVLMLTVLPVMCKLIDGVDLFKITRLWLWYAVAFPFFRWFTTWVFKKYKKTIQDADNVLKELAEA
ncbi:hypothetical protein [Mucilaginibacter xinganensis]|uniref:Uncharacterized protein n=1 Tax=Mucilaginibacter xinganensis TaxID=1234841 RepID=A0A223NSR7_9SPHI|nr:hypothetical protein [Mucilaginibacter xinganensis]ASU32810.1 hypothetical protein MuYL_0910 [Mucilaginibacter xinganensis]